MWERYEKHPAGVPWIGSRQDVFMQSADKYLLFF